MTKRSANNPKHQQKASNHTFITWNANSQIKRTSKRLIFLLLFALELWFYFGFCCCSIYIFFVPVLSSLTVISWTYSCDSFCCNDDDDEQFSKMIRSVRTFTPYEKKEDEQCNVIWFNENKKRDKQWNTTSTRHLTQELDVRLSIVVSTFTHHIKAE